MADIMEPRTDVMLQVNTSGAWRNVLTFSHVPRAEIIASLATLANTLTDSATWCLHHPDGKREWLHPEDFASAGWHTVTPTEPAELEDVMVSVYAPGDDEPVVFMAYRQRDGQFYLSGTCDQMIKGIYAFATIVKPAPLPKTPKAQQAAA